MPDTYSNINTARASAVANHAQNASVLVVADQASAHAINESLNEIGMTGPRHVVSECLVALGHMAQDSPTVVICHIGALDQPIEVTARAFRDIAPEARLLLIAPAQRRVDAEHAVSVGFDQAFLDPVEPQRLLRAITGSGSQTPHVTVKRDLPGNVQPRRDAKPSGKNQTVACDPLNELANQLNLDGPRQPQTQSGSGRLQAAEMAIFEQFLQSRGGAMGQTAIQTVLAGVGIAGVGWVENASQVPSGDVSVAVANGGQNLGCLHSPSSDGIDRLQQWGDRLGRWLALGRRVDELWRMGMRDEMTGIWNRRYFNQFLNTVLDHAAHERFYVSLLVFDIDDFKSYNDQYGHMAGDEILHETARLMQSLVRDHDVVARIGGDEFGVIFWDPTGPRRANSAHPHDPVAVAKRFQKAICGARFPKLGHEAPGTLTISGGLAGFPWDGYTPDQLLDRADKMAMRSKQQGKNAITFGPGAQRFCRQNGDR